MTHWTSAFKSLNVSLCRFAEGEKTVFSTSTGKSWFAREIDARCWTRWMDVLSRRRQISNWFRNWKRPAVWRDLRDLRSWETILIHKYFDTGKDTSSYFALQICTTMRLREIMLCSRVLHKINKRRNENHMVGLFTLCAEYIHIYVVCSIPAWQ